MEEIEYLYHYTSLESLALILKNRTIRLNPLDKMDDLQEQKTADIENLGKYVFVSSWTDDSVESIPMWRMYTNSTAGVRIKLRKNPFLWRDVYVDDVARETEIPFMPYLSSDGKIHTFVDLENVVKRNIYLVEGLSGNILRQVIYTDDVSLLEPKVFRQDSERITLLLGALGLHKSNYWSFQREWRYKMQIIPLNYKNSSEKLKAELAKIMSQMVKGIGQAPCRYYDLDISPEAFSEMEIVCSPQMTYGNKVMLEALVEKYNPNAVICESELRGKI